MSREVDTTRRIRIIVDARMGVLRGLVGAPARAAVRTRHVIEIVASESQRVCPPLASTRFILLVTDIMIRLATRFCSDVNIRKYSGFGVDQTEAGFKVVDDCWTNEHEVSYYEQQQLEL